MCGIAGFTGIHNRRLLKAMTDILVHRGPDDEGFYSDEHVSLGMRRLSIIDLEGGHQPIYNEDKSIWVILNGEIYNFKALREQLIKKGHRFYTKSDTEVVVHLYEDYGEDCVHHLRGMFAFALWDKNRQQLLLARDRLGIKPLYYMSCNGKLLFSSEIKSLLEFDGYRKEVDPQALLSFLTFLYIPSPQTIFKGIKKLEPGHLLIHRKGELTIRQYWDLAFPDTPKKTEEDYCEEARQLLKESVKLHMVSDVPLGVFLSGGLDSSAIVALMTDFSSVPIKTFSIGYGQEAKSYNELEYAKLISKRFGTEHHEFIVKPDIVEILPKLVWHLDEPFADSSLIPTYLVSKAIRSHATVALTGIGGDEVFGGYPRYLGARWAGKYEILPAWIRRSLAHSIGALPESTRSRNLAGWAKRFIKGGVLSERDRYISWISFYDHGRLGRLLTSNMKAQLKKAGLWNRHRDFYGQNNGSDTLDRAFYLDVKTYLADDLLMMGDKMSMATSLELRVPFCDHKLVEFAAGIPSEMKFRGSRLKSLFKKAMEGLLPKEILTRKKQGFMIPIAQWLQKDARPFTLDLLSETNIRKRGYFNPQYIHWMLEQHYTGRQNLTDQIFALMTLELWHRIYLDGERF